MATNLKGLFTEVIDVNLEREKNYDHYWQSIFRDSRYAPASQLNQGLQTASWRDEQLAQSFIKMGDMTYVRDDLRPQDGWRLVGGGSTSPVAASPPAKPVERTIEDDIDAAIQAMRAKS